MNAGRSVKWAGIAAVAFGALTVMAGGRTLFGGPEALAAMGDVVPFALWFNFLAGFVYVLTGIGLLLRARWAVLAAVILAASTLLVFAAFGIHVANGGAFEMRTVFAMTVRSLFWIAVALISVRAFRQNAQRTTALR